MEYNYTFAELIGVETVNQIKEVLLKSDLKDDFKRISNDIDFIVKSKDLKLTARFIRLVICLAQFDLHIWYCKDQMVEHPDKYTEYLIKAHQINGIRNRIKNLISEFAGDSVAHTNDSPDGLDWEISL